MGANKTAELIDPINVSALNQYSYCPRRCALIYLESEFSDNVHTSRGNAEHERVDRIAHSSTKDGARVEYALPIWSERLGLVGKCDVVEFWPDGAIYPVEYKHGSRKQRENDDLQLAAQSICLEEMFDRQIDRGAIFHAKSKRRRELIIDTALKSRVVAVVTNIRDMLSRQKLPPPVNDERCTECSMHDICQPEVKAWSEREHILHTNLFDPET
jgi:CRISPR-associated exonuclease Cas4